MPKAKPDQVIVHRIELQESERRIVEQVAAGYTMRNVTKSIFNVTSDMTTVIILVILYEYLFDREGANGLVSAILDALDAISNPVAAAIGGVWEAGREARQRAADDYNEYGEAIADFWSELFGDAGAAGAGFRSWLRGNRSPPSTFGGVTAEDRASAGY